MNMNKQSDNKWRVGSVGKALAILDSFDIHHSEQSLAQISAKIGVPKSTTYNLVKTLLEEGFLRKSSVSQNYLLGLKPFEMGYCVRNSLPIISYAIPIMEDITRITGEITYLSTVNRDRLIILEGIYPDRRFAAYSTAGKALPLHCCSAGKVILSTLPDSLTQAITERGMEQSTPNTICTQEALAEELSKIRQNGYAVDNEEETLGVRCASVAVRGSGRRAVGAISISGSVRSVTDEKIIQTLPHLEKAAQFLSRMASAFPAVYFDETY